MSKSNHNNYVAIAKALAIMLMVVGHSGCPKIVGKTIYLFHMPFFFICSGLFFSPHSEMAKLKQFILRKVKGIYLPFIKWCLLFTLLHNLFYHLNIYNDLFGYKGSVSHLFTMKELLGNMFYNVIKMDRIPPLLGGFWFIRDLFFASLFVGVITFLAKSDTKRVRVIVFCFLFVGSIFFGYVHPIGLYFITVRDLFWSSTFLYSGYLLRNVHLTRSVIIICFVIFMGGIAFPHHLEFSSDRGFMFVFYLTAMAGTILLLKLSEKLESVVSIRDVLYYAGNHTLVILGLHILAFKIVNLIIIYTESLDITHLAEFPVIANHVEYSPLYAFFGVFTPLPIYYIYSHFKIFWGRKLKRAEQNNL